MSNTEAIADLIDEIERFVATRQKEMSVKQAFDGTLRVLADEMYIGKGEGERALEELKQSVGHLMHSGK